MKISKNKKVARITCFKKLIPRSQSVLCSLYTDRRTDGQTDKHESKYRRYPFRVSGNLSLKLASMIGQIF